ncbi:MAG TPA: hypothetical protein PKD54_03785 [Pirellulaceae bacterium]|mgnify:CR=1 FL=1|nr:hypothetical protein [Pirellulaceae bacterium]
MKIYRGVMVFGLCALAMHATALGQPGRSGAPLRSEGTLKVGHAAPTFVLRGLEDDAVFDLRESVGVKPVVLLFGSYS